MIECKHPPVGKGALFVDDMRSIDKQCFGKLAMVMQVVSGGIWTQS